MDDWQLEKWFRGGLNDKVGIKHYIRGEINKRAGMSNTIRNFKELIRVRRL
jgi:hypothetical protein